MSFEKKTLLHTVRRALSLCALLTQYINYKLSIDYKFELQLYNLDLLMAPFTYEACL